MHSHVEQGLTDVLDNFPAHVLAVLLRTLLFPFGLPHRPPSDELGSEVALVLLPEVLHT